MDSVDIRTFTVDHPAARGLVDPYTGNPIDVVGRVSGHVVTFSAPDAFSLAIPVGSVDTLYDRASMRGGVAGAVTRDESLVCAYTGERMALAQTPDGKWCFRGGFNPRRAHLSLAEFIRKASCGTRDISDPAKAEMATGLPTDPDAGKADAEAADAVGEELNEAAETFCKAAGLDRGKTTVSMAAPAKRRTKAK